MKSYFLKLAAIYLQQSSNKLTKLNRLIICLIILLLQIVYIRIVIATTVTDMPDELVKGKEIYNYYCYQCHGYAGDAKTLASTYLDPKPRNFKAASLSTLTRESMLITVRDGRSTTAMMAFASVLNNDEIESVVDYIRENLMSNNQQSQRYHTDENGWPQHDRYAKAFPFVYGEISLDTAWEKLNKQDYEGKQLYLNACITCHDHAKTKSSEPIWEIRAASYPRKHYSHKLENTDALSGASIHVLHEKAIPETGLSEQEKQGRQLYLDNCAFCHAPDGSAKNWIGSFMDKSPKNFTNDDYIDKSTDEYLQKVILEGVKGTSMPAWEQVLTIEQVQSIIVFLRRAFGTRQTVME